MSKDSVPEDSVPNPNQRTRVVLCGSMSSLEKIEDLASSFRSAGYEAVTPNRDERDDRWASLTLDDQVAAKREFIDAYLEEIQSADVVVLANFDQNGIGGYVGANTLMEAAFAKALDIPVVLYQAPGPQPCQVELLAVGSGHLSEDPLNLAALAGC